MREGCVDVCEHVFLNAALMFPAASFVMGGVLVCCNIQTASVTTWHTESPADPPAVCTAKPSTCHPGSV